MKRLIAIAVIGVLVAGCDVFPAKKDGTCVDQTKDRIFIDVGDPIRDGLWCFDDGDGYPTVYAPATTAPAYPTVG